MAVHHLVLLLITLLLWPIKASELLCPDSCGNVNIWYPFGIGERCYFNKWFEVTCLNSSGSTKAFLSAINNLELSEFLLYSSFTVGITVPVISLSGANYTKAQGLDLSGSPFSFSNVYNRFAVIGCDNYFRIHISMSNLTIGGCLSICTCNSELHRGCYDFICPIPRSLGLKLYKSNMADSFVKCKSTLLVDQQWLVSKYLTNASSLGQHFLKDIEYVPAVLEWGMKKGRCVEQFNFNTSCNPDRYCLIQLSLGYFCLCDGPGSDNYIGCTGDLICNTSSGYSCSQCPDGYYSYQYVYDKETQCYPKIINRILIKESRLKFIMIIACGAGIGLLLLLLGASWLYKFIKRRKAAKLKQKFFKRNGGLLLQQHMSSNEGNIEKTKLFTSKELEKATDSYNTDRILGQGGQGTVYKGMLADGRIVAIKKSKIVDESQVEQFINEVVILSRIDHRNVVQLLGCCLEAEVPLLVYEFIPNGTLFQHIHDQNDEFPITWELRLRIAIEVVGALSYLHSAASMPIYHRDIKSTNILLDEKYRAKVSDFGMSRSIAVEQTHLTTHVHGTFGYLDPEYFRSSQYTEKSDVYSFGVVLAELLTGQKPIRSTNFEEDKSLAAYFLKAMKENRLFEVLDDRVLKEGGKKEIMTVANLTRQCLNLKGKKRPTMRELATELSGIRVSYNASISPKKCEETDYVDGNTSCQFENSSSFTGSMYVSFSIDACPLISNE